MAGIGVHQELADVLIEAGELGGELGVRTGVQRLSEFDENELGLGNGFGAFANFSFRQMLPGAKDCVESSAIEQFDQFERICAQDFIFEIVLIAVGHWVPENLIGRR